MSEAMSAVERREKLRRRYPKLPELQITRKNTALVVIDMQYGDAHPDYGLCARFKASGEQEVFREYTDRLPLIVCNTQHLLSAFREKRMEVVFSRIMSLTQDGRDRSLEHKNVDIHFPPDSKEAQILQELAPRGDEIILSKTCGSVFNGTMIHHVLRNIGIQNLVMTGVVTSGCVEIAVRDAADLSYGLIIIEDACATWTNELHADSIWRMDGVFGTVMSTEEVVRFIQAL